MPLSSGEQLGHYKIVSMIGKGGMGEVYLGTDTRSIIPTFARCMMSVRITW
jgi:serine/threonine protein kinase